MPRPIIIASLLGASIGVPYFASHTAHGTKSATSTSAPASSAQPQAASAMPATAAMPISTETLPVNQTPIESPQFQSVDQFLRFDVTRDWVYRYWNRKSTGPTDVGLFGVRVPLVMGTQMTSLAGSLTYFFNTNGQVEHISFRGRTADTTQLVSFLVQTYQFQRVESPVGEQVFQVASRGGVQSELRTRPEPVLSNTAPHNSIAVELELARPGSRRFLPPRGPFLSVPPAPSPPPAPAANNAGATADGSYFDNFRYATPQEASQVLWKRWPN